MDVMLRPARTYEEWVSAARGGGWGQALEIPALLVLLFGIVMSVAATGRIDVTLFITQALCWSFIPLLQLMTGSLLVASAPSRPVSFARGVALLFAGHGPWSIWLVMVAALQMLTPKYLPLASAILPSLWTAWILLAFSRTALGLTPRGARTRVILHQAATALMIVAYVEFASRLAVRLPGAWR